VGGGTKITQNCERLVRGFHIVLAFSCWWHSVSVFSPLRAVCCVRVCDERG